MGLSDEEVEKNTFDDSPPPMPGFCVLFQPMTKEITVRIVSVSFSDGSLPKIFVSEVRSTLKDEAEMWYHIACTFSEQTRTWCSRVLLSLNVMFQLHYSNYKNISSSLIMQENEHQSNVFTFSRLRHRLTRPTLEHRYTHIVRQRRDRVLHKDTQGIDWTSICVEKVGNHNRW